MIFYITSPCMAFVHTKLLYDFFVARLERLESRLSSGKMLTKMVLIFAYLKLLFNNNRKAFARLLGTSLFPNTSREVITALLSVLWMK